MIYNYCQTKKESLNVQNPVYSASNSINGYRFPNYFNQSISPLQDMSQLEITQDPKMNFQIFERNKYSIDHNRNRLAST
jgi:hypothetical protein